MIRRRAVGVDAAVRPHSLRATYKWRSRSGSWREWDGFAKYLNR